MPNPQFTDGVTVLIKHKWKIVLAVLILLTVITFLSIILPLLDGMIMGVVLAYVARPLKHFMDRYVPRLSPYIATAAIVLPIFLIIGFGVIEIFNLILWTFKNQGYVVSSLLNLMEKLNLPDFARDKIKDIILNFTSYLLPIVERLPVVTIVKTFSMFIINALLAVLLCFFLLVDGSRLVERIIDIIPQDVEDFFRRFMNHLDGILSAIFVGNTYSAIAVGLLSLIVFWVFGFANIVALSALMLLAALVPMLAGWMVIVPLTIYRYFETGSESAIIFFIVSFLVVIIPPELLIRPYIIHTRSNIHPLLIIISFVGGGLVGGIAGFFIAPMLLGVIVAAYRASSEIRKGEILKHE
jgi:predicted PurR-regulated permease PerM